MSGTSLNFMPMIELYLVQQQSIKDSYEELQNSEAKLEQLTKTLQESEMTLKQMDTYLQAKSSTENLNRIHEDNILSLEKTKLQIMEILLIFPNLSKIQLNQSKINPQYLVWDLEESTFTLTGF